MPDESARRALIAHLEFFRELGVEGFSREPIWYSRERPTSTRLVRSRRRRTPRQWMRSTSPAISVDTHAIPVTTKADAILLREIRVDIGDCTRCKLHALGRKQVVFGVGNPQADLMFVGEAPGADEDNQGEPFVGRAGQLLTKIIEAMGRKRERRLHRQRHQVPSARATGIRSRTKWPRASPSSSGRSIPFSRRSSSRSGRLPSRRCSTPRTPSRGCAVASGSAAPRASSPTFHPAYLLRNPASKRDMWEDMKMVMSLLASNP